ncbi:iron-containing alcohol dehydrogenase [Paenibacillus sp. FJAT-26967]|uniref:iron-containing alcohol dehydrogenase n=1 Tax=Paenibacillus sp. FJAT-26967 TaxID=1729690 RepID=UPI000837A9C5|nr:iron-containing alcohol dehydrogenase [Paenibacillus sp. FJAT-26967]
MNPFIFYNPTKLIFGRGQLEQLPKELSAYGNKVLLVYGGGSIKRNGVYDQVTGLLKGMEAEIHELSGVEPNPRLSTVERGVEICKAQQIDVLLAVGGGSVIDCTKAIAVGAKYEGSMWDFVKRKALPEDALPFGTVLTLAATGSEMNSGSVITNWDTQEKLGWGSSYAFPKFSILDPEFTASVPEDQTVYGMVDIMSHVLEQYFHHTPHAPVQDGLAEALLKTVISTAPKLIADPTNFEHREIILYSGTMALNGLLAMGIKGDWATHNLEHAVSAVYDIPHGGGLAILFPNWMNHVLGENVGRFKQFAVHVFDIDPAGKSDRQVAEEGIQALRDFWTSIGAPSRLADYKIDDKNFDVMVDRTLFNGPFGNFKRLDREDVLAIYRASL